MGNFSKNDSFFDQYARIMSDNTPDTSMQNNDWETISNKLPVKKTRRRHIFWIWYIIGLIAILSLALITLQKSTIPTKNERKDFAQSINKKSSDFHLMEKGDKQIMRETTHYKSKSYQSKVKNVRNNIFELNSIATTIVQKNEQKLSFDHLDDKIVYSAQSLNLTQNPNVDSISTLYLIPIKNADLKFISKPISLNNSVQNLPIKAKRAAKWIGRLNTGIILHPTIHCSVRSMDNQNQIEQHIISMNGKQFGITTLLQPSPNWRLGLGIIHSEQNFVAHHNFIIKSNNLSYLSTDNNNINSYNYNYELNEGNTKSRVSIRFFDENSGVTVGKADTISANMSFRRSHKKMSIPFVIERKLIQFDNLMFYGRLGASMDITNNISNTINHYDETCKELCFSHDFKPIVSTTLNNNAQLNGSLGLSLEYQINKNFTIGLNPEVLFSSHETNKYINLYFSYIFKK